MGTKRTRSSPHNEYTNKLSVPPGFASLTSFRLRQVNNIEHACSSMASAGASEVDQNQMDSSFNEIDVDSLKRSFWHRPWMLYDQNKQNQEESDSEHVVTDIPSTTSMPRGVADGCPDSSNRLKEMESLCPENAKRDVLEEVLVFYPTEEEFKDTLNYIASIRSKVEQYGMCRIVPPPTWDPPCLIKKKNIWETSSFATKIQRLGGVRNNYITHVNGSCKKSSFRLDDKVGNGCANDADGIGCSASDIEGFGSEIGPEFTLETFQRYANDFKSRYFCARSIVAGSDVCATVDQGRWEPSLDDIEVEYRQIVENPSEEIEVLYSGDLDSGAFGSGFPTKSRFLELSDSDEYTSSGWNLNKTPRLPGSLLSFESFRTTDVLVPQLRVGMFCSSLCWKVEEHHLYSLCYLHLGDPKIWYSIPGRCNVKFQAVMKKRLRDLSPEQLKVHDRLVSNLSPSMLKSKDIPVNRCIQHPGEFVLVLPGAFYSVFDSGFNCAEAVNVAPIDWLPHGQLSVELYREKGIKTTISYDKLLLGAVREAIRSQWEISLLRKYSPKNLLWKGACGKDGILAKALKSRIEMEGNKRKYLCTSSLSQKMDEKFNYMVKRECITCFYDLHLSAVACRCSTARYACLNHSKQLCSCAWSERIFIFRHEIGELNTLLEALEGKLGAVYKSARDVLKLALFEDSLQIVRQIDHQGLNVKEPEEKQHKSEHEATPRHTVSSIKEELKARMLLSKSLNARKQVLKSSASRFAATATPNDHRLISLRSALELRTSGSSSSSSG